MKWLFAMVAFCCIFALPASGAEHKTLQVTAKLVDIPSKFPPDDLYDYAYVMKYEVQGGPMDKKIILVAHYKPRQARKRIKGKMKKFVQGRLKRFKVGDVHKMLLDPDMDKIWKDAVIDDFFATDRKSIRYWCLKVDPA